MIVVDNHSTDDTDSVLASHACACLRVLKVHNGGSIAYSRNRGIAAARGGWIAFLDSDDWWKPEKIETCARFFSSSDFIYHKLQLFNESSQAVMPRCIRSNRISPPLPLNLLRHGNPIATSSVVVRRSILKRIGGFDERAEIIAAEDYDAWLRISMATNRFCFVGSILGFYHYSSTSASRKDMSLPLRSVYAAYSNVIPAGYHRCVDANAAYASGRYAFQVGNYKDAIPELLSTLLHGRVVLKIRASLLLVAISFKRAVGLFVNVFRS